MNNRELFHATMRHENGNLLLHMEQGFNIVYDKWLHDGLPGIVENVDFPVLSKGPNLYDFMNVTGYLCCNFNQFCIPAYEEKIIEQTSKTKKYINTKGVTLIERTVPSIEGTASYSPPYEADFSIKNMNDYLENRFRFIGNYQERVDFNWLNKNETAYCEQEDYLTTLWVHGPFAFLREILGTENAMVLSYEEPEMIKMMLKDHLETSMASADYVIRTCKPDMCFIWEDCCGSTGPFISPSIFDQFVAPWYKQWKAYLKSMGVQWLMLDTDGDPSPLVKRWYDAGVDCMQPWEVNAVDMLKFAEEYPQYTMMGGIYKHMFEPGDLSQVGRFQTDDYIKAIDDELERVVKPMAKRGGYIAALDHWAFWGTTFDGYKHYTEKLYGYGKSNISKRGEQFHLKA